MDLLTLFNHLSLNEYEKQVLAYLITIESADAKAIYHNTKVPLGRLYGVLNELHKKDLLIPIPTTPKRFTIKNPKETFKRYLEKEQEAVAKLILAVDTIVLPPPLLTFPAKSPTVTFFTGRDEHLRAIYTLYEKAKKEIIQSSPLFIGSTAIRIARERAIKRGVKIRIITHSKTKANHEAITHALNLAIPVKILPSPDLLSLTIIDNHEFILGVEDYHNKEERLVLYSKNKALQETLQQTFEKLWHNATPLPS